MGEALIESARLRRRLPALVAAIVATFLLASAAYAFTLENAGFTATSYATGFATNAGGHGPLATAWQGNVLWSVDAADGGLYRADAGGVPSASTSLVATRVNATAIAGGVRGLAYGGGHLYATLETDLKVVELSMIDGSIVRTLTVSPSITCPASLAADPLTGDLIVTGCNRVWRIADPAGAATPSIYAKIASGLPTHAIAIGPDGTIFVVSDSGPYSIESTAVAATHAGLAVASPMSSAAPGIVGLGVVTNGVDTVPQFLIASTSSGAVYKIPGLGGSGDTLLVLDGAGAGEQVSIGPDRCAYASMGGEVVRVADASGGCELALAGVTPPSISLANTTGQDAHVNGPAITVRATLAHETTPVGNDITFTVTGAHARVVHVTTDASGTASYSYVGTTVGTDTIVASSLVDGFAVTSNTVTIEWLPESDQNPPTISFSYTVPPGGTGVPFDCPNVTSDQQRTVICGWFTKAPTIHFTVTANGPSGLGPLANCGDYTLDYQPGPDGHSQTCHARNGDQIAEASLTVVIKAILSPPTVTATATANGAPYVAGAVTRGPVTVHFTCTSPIAVDLACPADETFSGTGTYTAFGTATDAAGQRTTGSFGPIVIDTAPPTITVNAGGYVFGAWTGHDVLLTFTCADNVAVAACPAPLTVTASTPAVTVTATDTAGNVGSLTTGAIRIDRTPPVTTATVTGTPAGADTYALSVTVALAATDTEAGVASVTYTIDGGAAVTAPGASASFTVTAIGAHTVTFHATDAVGNAESDGARSFTIIAKQPTALTITSASFVAEGTPVTARLLTDIGAPVAGEPVRFAAGGLTRTAITDAYGVASAILELAPGTYLLTAVYDGGASYFGSTAAPRLITVFGASRFVVWSANAVVGERVQLYGAQWAKQIDDKDARRMLDGFKGYAAAASGATWAGRAGDKTKPPKTLPRFVGVLVTSHATKTKDGYAGDIVAIAIVRIEAGREHADEGSSAGDAIYGTVVGLQGP